MKPNAHTQNMAVVVPSLTPALGLLVMQSTPEHTRGEVLKLYGGYKSPYDGTETVYTDGTVPPDWRLAVEEEGYDNEVLFLPLPPRINEIALNENPDTYALVLTDCKVIAWPQPEGRQIQFTPPKDAPFAPVGECRVIEHPAKRQQPAAQLSFPFADKPNQQSA